MGTAKHRAKGFGLNFYQKDLAKKISKKLLTGSGRINPTDTQELLAFWESEGTLRDGDCMSFREYIRSMVDGKFRKAPQWEAYEEGIRFFMGEYYYNKI